MSEENDIGKQLRKARESKNLSHADISETTRIPAAMLAALEREDYSDISPAYARSFLIQYSEYLSVDASGFAGLLKSEDSLSGLSEHSYLQQGPDRIRKKGEKSSHHARRRKQSGSRLSSLEIGKAIKNTVSYPLVTGIALLVALALLIAGGVYSYKKYDLGNSHAANDPAIAKAHDESLAKNHRSQPKGELPSAGSDSVSTVDLSDLFDPLSPSSNLRGLARDTSTDDAIGKFGYAKPNAHLFPMAPETAVNQEDENELPERNSPPPKAMVIDEDEE